MRIASSQPYLDIHTTNAVMRIEQEPVRLTANHKRAQMRVRTTRPTFKVSRKQLRTNNNSARTAELQRRQAVERRRQIMQRQLSGSLSDVTQGQSAQELASINTADLVASLTIRRSLETGVSSQAVVDTSVAKVDWDPGSVEIEWDPYKLEMSWEGDMRPKITVTPHTVEIRLINGKTIRVGENEAKALEMQGYGKRMDEKV